MKPPTRPDGPFIEVPYSVYGKWIAKPWADFQDGDGFPVSVRRASYWTPSMLTYIQKVVRVYPTFDAYQAATGRTECPVGRAWVGPTERDPNVVGFITGCLSAPTSVGGRWRW